MKRTAKQIERDFRRIQNFIKDGPSISSLEQISNALDLSVPQVRTSLNNHPIVFNRLKTIMIENRSSVPTNDVATDDVVAKERTQEIDKSHCSIVIDASIAGNVGIVDKLNGLIKDGHKIVLTSVTIRELEKMQRFKDADAKDARKILSLAAGNTDDFICVSIREDNIIADDNIIQYCKDHKSEVILMTSDKTMDLKARSFDVKTDFIQHHSSEHKKHGMHKHWGKVSTLYDAKYIGGKLILSNFYGDFKNLRVIRSDELEFNDGEVELKIGDDIYIGTKKERILTFAHYQLTSLSSQNNCRLVFSRRIFNSREIDRLPQPTYRSFMLDFKMRFDSWKF